MGKKCLPFDNAIHFKSNKASKCACIVSNHDSNHTRLQMVNELHEKNLIHCSGGLGKKNYKRIGSGKDEKGKQDCLHQFNFNISIQCFRNRTSSDPNCHPVIYTIIKTESYLCII